MRGFILSIASQRKSRKRGSGKRFLGSNISSASEAHKREPKQKTHNGKGRLTNTLKKKITYKKVFAREVYFTKSQDGRDCLKRKITLFVKTRSKRRGKMRKL